VSVVVPTIARMEAVASERGGPALSETQRRTAIDLIETGPGRTFPPRLARDLRHALEEGVAPFLPWERPALSLSKERLNLLGRCDGLFQADLLGERPPFVFTPASAAGTLAHASVELDVHSPDELPAADVARLAADRLQRDRRFRPYWEGLQEAHRAELLARARDSTERFRASFPPVRDHRRRLAPVTELWLETPLGRGAVVLRGKVDLLVGASRRGAATRVLIDLKNGRPSPDHAEDMRWYALLFTLRTGAPPYRVATFFLASGQWQPEEVDEAVLGHAVDRAVRAIGAAARLRAGGSPDLRPGRHCLRCPRVAVCPAVVGTG
jgi:PD-(D/E)XK nuclease superfamily